MYKFLILILSLTVASTLGLLKIPLYRNVHKVTRHYAMGLSLSDYKSYQYFAYIAIGTPPQFFIATFDTTAENTWVLSTTCDSHTCQLFTRYNHSLSSSHISGNGEGISETQFSTGKLKGTSSWDSVAIGPCSTKVPLLFLEVETVDDDLFRILNYDAVVGLATNSLADSGLLSTSLMRNMEEKKLLSPISAFSFYFNKNTEMGTGGVLTLGGYIESFYIGNLTFVPLTGSQPWQFDVDKITFIENNLIEHTTAVVDTSEALLVVPKDLIDRLYKEMWITTRNQGLQVVDCDMVRYYPDLVFTIAGKPFPLTSEDYIIRDITHYTETCELAIKPGDTPHWVLGDVFLRHYYTAFDVAQKKIGFAEAFEPFLG